jgi:tetratricopeptide (TPR) repeat protein
VLADLASSYLRVGLIDQTIDRNDDAIEAFQQAMVIVERLRNQYPAATEQHCMLAGFWKGFRQTKAGTKLPTDPTEARRTLEKFTEFWEAFARENPAVTGFQSDLAAVYTYLGALLAAQHRKADALPFFYKARVIGDRLVHENPAVPEYRADLGRTCEQLADVLIDLGRNQEADELVGEALALREQVTTDSPGVPQRLVDLSESLQSLGDRLALSGRTQEAETAYRRAVDIRQKLAAERPDVPLYQERFAVTLTALAKLLKDNGRLPEAEDAYRQALVIAEKLAVDTPTEYYHHSRLGKVYTGLAELLKDTGRQREAEVAFRKAIAEYEQVIAQSPRHGWTLAQSCFSLGALLAAAGRHEDAEGAYRQAIQPLQRLLAASPDNWCRYDLAGAFYQVGILRWAANRPQEAVQAFRQAREEYEKLIAERSADSGAPMVFWLNNLAWLLATCPDANFRDHSRAVELATKGVELAPEWRCPWNTLGAAHYRAGGAGGLMPAGTSVWNTLGAALYRSGQWNAATDALQKSMETGSGGDGFDWFFLAMAYWHLGQKDEARKWYDRGAEWMQKNMPGDPELLPIRAEAADLMGITDPLSPEKHSPATEDQAP